MDIKIEQYAQAKIHSLLNLRPFPNEIEEVLLWRHREHRLILHLSLIEHETEKIKEIIEMYKTLLGLVKEGWTWPNASN